MTPVQAWILCDTLLLRLWEPAVASFPVVVLSSAATLQPLGIEHCPLRWVHLSEDHSISFLCWQTRMCFECFEVHLFAYCRLYCFQRTVNALFLRHYQLLLCLLAMLRQVGTSADEPETLKHFGSPSFPDTVTAFMISELREVTLVTVLVAIDSTNTRARNPKALSL